MPRDIEQLYWDEVNLRSEISRLQTRVDELRQIIEAMKGRMEQAEFWIEQLKQYKVDQV